MAKRVAVVTGAASGIGLAVAEALANENYRLVMADINTEAGQREADRLGAHFVQADLINREACKALIDSAVGKFGSVDVLVNNAGIQHVSPVEDHKRRRMISSLIVMRVYAAQHQWSR